MKRSTKQIIAGLLIVPGILGTIVYSANAGEDFTSTIEKTNPGSDSSKIVATSDNNKVVQTLNDSIGDQMNFGVSPRYAVTTGFDDSFKKLEADNDSLYVQTYGVTSLSSGISSTFKQEIFIDEEIATEFFSTPDYQKYISGTVSRNAELNANINKPKVIDVKDLWGKTSGERIVFDANENKIVYYGHTYSVTLSKILISLDLKIDLGQWKKDTGRLVERKDSYTIQARSSTVGAKYNGAAGAVSGYIDSSDILDSWIENPVEPTTLYRLEESPSIFRGNGEQDLKNEHLSDYTVELLVNNIPFKEVQMDEEWNWDFDFGSYLSTDDVVSARVKGTDVEVNGNNDIRDVRYSSQSYAVYSTDNVSWNDWKVEAPIINQGYTGDMSISGWTKIQNRQLDRSYSLDISINGETIKTVDNLKDDVEIISNYFSGLKSGDVVVATVTGHQKGEKDKSVSTTMIVEDESEDKYENWEVQKAEFLTPLYEGEQSIKGRVPVQNSASGRTYDLELFINDVKTEVLENIPVNLKPYNFEFNTGDELKYKDKVQIKVVGHEEDYEDKSSKVDKEVLDSTDYTSWRVNKPSIDEMVNTDTSITGNIGEQSTEAGRTYKVALLIDNEAPIYVKPEKDGSFKLEDVVLEENQQVTAAVIGSQSNREDKESEKTIETVKDASNYAEWKVNKPTVNALEDGKVAVTGTIGEQNKEFARTYDVEVFVNGETQGAATVASDDTFTTKEISLKEGDKVTATVTGHQSGKADKTATSAEVIVSDSSHYDEWTVAPASLDEVFAHADSITGELPKEDSSYGRNYEIIAKVDGKEIARNKVEDNQAGYTIALPETVDLKEGQTVSVQVVGHQEGKEDKLSSETSVKVQEQVFTTASNFKNGYWQNYGLVYEGQIDNQGWDMSDGSRVIKTAQLVNHTTGEVVTEGIKAANTNWYDSSRYNGYQIIISNDVLSKLEAGEYTIQLTVAIDGETKETIDLALDQVISRMGPMHDNYADLEEVVIERNTITPKVIDNKPGFTIIKDTEASVQVFNKYWNGSDQLIFEGYVNASADLTDVTKKLIIKDASGGIVETGNIQNFASSWGIPVDVDESQSFQAIVPNEYSNQAKYTYELVYTDADGKTLLTEVLK